MVARGDSLADTLTALCELVEDSVMDSVCSVMLVDSTGVELQPAAAPNLPTHFVASLAGGIPVAEGLGSCGTAAFRREPVVVVDSRVDPLFEPYREVMDENGLRACWSTPILASSDGRVLGTFAVYWSQPCEPTAGDRAVVDNLVHLGAIAIERKQSEQQLEFQAHHDPLTGLPNRALFLEFLSLALARARRKHNATAVLFLDLDEFKNYNDSLGHDHGDELLVAVGQRLRGVLRPGDTLARFGGDEFTVLCEDLGGPDAKQHAIDVAERLLEALRLPFLPDGEERFLSASVGIALAAGSRELPEDLLRDADAAMYRAKARGKARWELFDERMRARARERIETESALHRALERNEFRLFYQPIVSLTEARYVGVEALVRWQHPERGLVAPQDFVTLAEETGLVVPLGAWVLRDVCRQYGEWRKDARVDPNLVIAVNLSAKQISHPGIVETVEAALSHSQLPARSLCLEITESVLLDDTGPALKTLPRAQGPRRAAEHGRLRHRLLVARVPQAVPHRLGEGGPVLRRRPRHRRRGLRDRRGRREPRSRARAHRRRRGRRDRGSAHCARRARVRPGTGLLLLPTAARRRADGAARRWRPDDPPPGRGAHARRTALCELTRTAPGRGRVVSRP